jgi:hypothetical protein
VSPTPLGATCCKKKGVVFLKSSYWCGILKQSCYEVLPVPKVQLTFDLPEEQEEYRTCMAAGDLFVACEDADNRCRALLKWADSPSEDAVRLAKEIREILGTALHR